MKPVIGLTGGIGSGKSTVADLLAEAGAAVIDTDAIAHELTAPGGAAIAAIRETFGDEFITDAGALDRPRMRRKVFGDDAARKQLEHILHPLIRQAVDNRLQQTTGDYVLLMVPLLVETGAYRELIDRTLVVDIPETLQLSRTMERSKLSAAEVQAIMDKQASRTTRLAAADDIVINDSDINHLRRQLLPLHQQYLSLASSAKKR